MNPQTFADEILPILCSPMINGYTIGLTSNAKARRASYKYKTDPAWKYFYIIVDNLTQDKAKKMEELYFYKLISDKRTVHYRKYDEEKREGPYRRSVGGKKLNTNEKYCIYIACD